MKGRPSRRAPIEGTAPFPTWPLGGDAAPAGYVASGALTVRFLPARSRPKACGPETQDRRSLPRRETGPLVEELQDPSHRDEAQRTTGVLDRHVPHVVDR